MTAATVLAAGMLCAHGALCLLRLLRASSLGDRVVALDAILLAIVNGLALHALWTRSTAFVDVMVVTALLAFVGTVAVARFIEDRR